MRIKVEVHGHQQYFEHEGEPLAWLQTFDNDGRGSYLQVPAVLLKTADAVLTIPLETRLTHTKITVLEP